MSGLNDLGLVVRDARRCRAPHHEERTKGKSAQKKTRREAGFLRSRETSRDQK
jgi:hypothetical protein